MIRSTSFIARATAIVCSLAMVNLGMPMGIPKWLSDHWPSLPHRGESVNPPVRSRLLSLKEMRAMKGSWGENPYLAGSRRFSVGFDGVDLTSGNFSTSVTDLSFEGGYGIPIAVTRTYNSNIPDEGPLGKGWSLSLDIRTTAGGLLKKGTGASITVPVAFHERSSASLHDPYLATGVEAAVAVDASGEEETVQRDVDGILTPPAWDKNVVDSTYEWVSSGGQNYRILTSNTVTTPDGTTLVYEKVGEYSPGVLPYDDPNAAPQPSNVLKLTSATDRHGNTTTYVYDTFDGDDSGTYQTYVKADGTTHEALLRRIEMPNGHKLYLAYGSGALANRVTQITANTSNGSVHVDYGYTQQSGTNRYMLTSSTTPAGYETTYDYGTAINPNSEEYEDATDLLTSVTDPRGLTTSIEYFMTVVPVQPYQYDMQAPVATKVSHPNGVVSFIRVGQSAPSSGYPSLGEGPLDGQAAFQTRVGNSTGEILTEGTLNVSLSSSDYTLGMFDPDVVAAQTGQWSLLGTSWVKTYNGQTLDLMAEESFTFPWEYGDMRTDRKLANVRANLAFQSVHVDRDFNFMGNPLTQDVKERDWSNSGSGYTSTQVRETVVDYAYWDGSKYFQQKAVRTTGGDGASRFSYTDYFDKDETSAGNRGQTRYVYDPTTTYSNTGSTWKSDLVPSDPTKYAASFAYDSVGRPADVYKLQDKTTTPWTYVQTHTTYSDASGTWGEATMVEEDYGGIDRTTQTTDFDEMGRATDVIDGAGQTFHTDYDLDGRVNSVTRTDLDPDVTVVEYTYGTSGVENGTPVAISDGLSGVSQSFTYQSASGGGLGQIQEASQTLGSTTSSASYTYTDGGERLTASYTTSQGTTNWGYGDYVRVGSPEQPNRAFQTLTLLDGNGDPTSETFHYQYNSAGRLTNAAFAQTPSQGDLAQSRALAWYDYDPAGRLLNLRHVWQKINTQGDDFMLDKVLLGNECQYNSYTGLKSQDDYTKAAGNPQDWTLDYGERFTYDNKLDYLTSASYNSGSTYTNWSYDAAGNRNDVTAVDNLNRATTIGGVSRTYDILGNTLTIGSGKTMTWDCLNRMATLASGSTTTAYTYRADGMRVRKGNPNTPNIYTDYAYDGQMPVEEFNYRSVYNQLFFIKVIRYGLGARGIDRIERDPVQGSPLVGYPIYDDHGNMIATLMKGSNNTCSLNDLRSYDAWGGIRTGNTSGEPHPTYCANLGHLQDDESGFVYMRARYYEPGAGRFVSEDPSLSGHNWYTYADNVPSCKVDQNGKVAELLAIGAYIFASGLISMLFTCLTSGDWSLKTMLRGFALGAVTAAGTLGGPILGGLVGGFAGMADAYLSKGNIWAGFGTGALAGMLGGAVGPLEAIAERQIVLYALLSFDIGAVTADANAFVGLYLPRQ